MDPRISAKLESKIPELLAEMRVDVREHPLIRKFILMKRVWSYCYSGEEFDYLYDTHPELDSMVSILENYGLVEDITSDGTKRYQISEELVDYLAGPGPADRIEQLPYLFHREGHTWALSFEGKTIHVPDMVGLDYIAELLRRPRTPTDADILVGTARENTDAFAEA